MINTYLVHRLKKIVVSETDGIAREEIIDVGLIGDGNDLNVTISMINGKGAPSTGAHEAKELMGKRAHWRDRMLQRSTGLLSSQTDNNTQADHT